MRRLGIFASQKSSSGFPIWVFISQQSSEPSNLTSYWITTSLDNDVLIKAQIHDAFVPGSFANPIGSYAYAYSTDTSTYFLYQVQEM